jgi:hypothetical protein
VIYLYMENVSRGAQRLASFVRRRPESEPELDLSNTRPEAAE